MGWDPTPPQKSEVPPGWHAGGGGEGGGDPEFGGGNVPFWGCGPFKRGAHPGLQLTAFWGKKVRFWGWGFPCFEKGVEGEGPNLKGGGIVGVETSHFWVEKSHFRVAKSHFWGCGPFKSPSQG